MTIRISTPAASLVLVLLLLGCGQEPAQRVTKDSELFAAPSFSTSAHTGPSVALQAIEILDLKGASTSLGDLISHKGIAVVFSRTDCPVGNRYVSTLNELHAEFLPQGVSVVQIYPDPTESAEKIAKYLAEYSISLPAFRDSEQKLVSSTGATVTPEVAIFDHRWTMVYRGRIDDRVVALGRHRPAPTSKEMHDVLSAVVAGAPVTVTETKAVGCFIE